MAFDQSTRNFLQRTVTKCREILAGRWQAPTEGEFFRQLQEIYGISPDGVTAPMEVLAHLGDEDRETARVLRDTIDHYAAGLKASGKAEKEARREAVMRVAREQAFTVLNRLAALRMAEERGIVLECVRKGTQSEGFQLFLQSAGNAYGSTSAAYRVYLQVIFDEMARDLGVLFNRFDKSSLLFPRHEALEALLKELSGTGEANRNASYTPEQVASFWGEDETIGWIYQYYNDPAERKKMREESAAPRNSRELAVRNQFFTPRYVVEFLTDNTLGRIWYEMTKGQTHLTEQCRYLVRRPTEIFLAEGEVAPETPKQEGLSQTELLKQPVHIPHRPLKDPREIRLLDPACGSMHFGLYAFDIFEAIYEEAWDKGFCPALQEAYLSKEEFLKDVPRLIIENNLHGIDIDPRATQIAALSLWLRAQKAWQQQKVPAADRPRVRRSNIVCAESMPGSPEMLEEFVATLKPDLLGELVKTVFDKMQLAGEAGSLLKIEEEIRTAIDTARKEWLKQQDDLLTRKDGSQEEFFDTAEQQVIDALRAYAEQADADSYQRRLFADDAARGFAFIDLCRKRYDAVVMNPPFGAFSKASRGYVAEQFPNSSNDIFAAFVECCLSRLTATGALGAITSRTGFFIASFADWRREIVQKKTRLNCFADLGGGVMDNATVEAAAYVLDRSVSPAPRSETAPFIRLLVPPDKEAVLFEAIQKLRHGERHSQRVFWASSGQFELLPDSPFVYWANPNTLSTLAKWPPFEPTAAQVRKGLRTGDNFRFVRALWEIPLSDFTPSMSVDDPPSNREKSKWVPLVLSGSSQPWFSPLLVALNWRGNGKELRQYVTKYGSPSRLIQAEDFYFRPGMSWTLRAARFVPYAIPSGCIPTGSRPMAFPSKGQENQALALSASRVASAFMRFYGDWFSRPKFLEGKVKLFPWPDIPLTLSSQLNEMVSREGQRRRSSYQGHEPFFDFIKPFSLNSEGDNSAISIEWATLLGADLEASVEQAFGLARSAADELGTELDEALSIRGGSSELDNSEEENEEGVELLLDCSERSRIDALLSYAVGCVFGRWDIRYATGERTAPVLADPFAPLPICPPGMLQDSNALPLGKNEGISMREERKYPLDVVWDGILVDEEDHPENIVARVREANEVIWKDRAEAIQQEACGILGVKTLCDYFRRPAAFFADHLKRYSKSRRQAPIYWPLSTKSGCYTLWLYYHRLTPDTLYKCIQQFVEPKMKDMEQTILRLRTMLTANEGGGKERKQLEDAETLLDELKEMHAELSLWAPKWKPNLNDGVLITACPLWKLFRLPKWRKDLEACWKELERGDYDWAHLAYTLFPDRVREKCKTDRSIAIAHNLEDLCQVQAPAPKAKRTKKQKEPTGEEAML